MDAAKTGVFAAPFTQESAREFRGPPTLTGPVLRIPRKRVGGDGHATTATAPPRLPTPLSMVGAIPSAELRARAFLLEISGPRTGRQVPLAGGRKLMIGRNADTDVQVEANEVSRVHCELEHHGSEWFVRDCNSTNGTMVNASEVERCSLRSGDRLHIGGTIFTFFDGSEPESRAFEAVHKAYIQDGLTGLTSRRAAQEVLERELARAEHSDGPSLFVVFITLANYERIKEEYGRLVGDEVLIDVAHSLASSEARPVRIEECLCRWDGGRFMVVTSDRNLLEAEETGRLMLASCPPTTERGEGIIPLQLRVSVIEALVGESAEALVDRSRTSLTPRSASLPPRQLLKLWREKGGILVALQVRATARLLAAEGAAGLDDLANELAAHIGSVVGNDDAVSSPFQRTVLVLVGGGAKRQQRLIEDIGRKWREALVPVAEPLPDDARRPVVFDVVVEVGDGDALQAIAGQLGGRSRGRELPFPLVVHERIATSRAHTSGQLGDLLNGVEAWAKVLCAIALRRLKMTAPAAVDDVLRDADDAPAGFGAWVEWLGAASRLLRGAHPLDSMLRNAWSDGRQGVLGDAQRAVALRNREKAHGTVGADAAYANDVADIERFLKTLRSRHTALLSWELVSVVSAKRASGGFRHLLRRHQGSSETFPVFERHLPEALFETWCYLVAADGTALSLAPIVACSHVDHGREELGLAQFLVRGPIDAAVPLIGATTTHKLEARLEEDGIL